MGWTLLRHLLQREHCVTLSLWCCRMPADRGRTRHRANFGGAQQDHRQLGLWQGSWHRRDPPPPLLPPDLTKKHCKTTLLHSLHVLLCQCWQEGAVPQDMRGAKIIILFKNMGERSDCNNYRGISLFSIIGKVFAKVILFWLQKLAERVYPESQCGFRGGRSTIDMVFSLCQLQEKCREQQMPLYIAFIDLTKAFDLVSRDGLFQIFPKIGCPPKLQSMIESFHTNMKGTVLLNGSSSRPFDIRSSVKQGCVLAPAFFGIFFALLLRHAFGTASEGICLQTRSDGRLFNLGRLRAKTKVREALIRDMLFVDDAAVTTHTQQELQALIDCFSEACKDFRRTISLKKADILGQDTMELPAITIDDYELDVIEQFRYLGSTITNNLSLDTEIDKRIGKAATTLARLTSRVWTNPKLTVKTKMVVYNACVDSTLMYGSKTWTHMPDRRKNSISSTWEASAVSLAYPGKTECPTPRSCPEPTFQACSPCSDSAGCIGWGMSTAWKMAASQKTFSLWRVGIWKEIQRPPTTALQGCLQERHESAWHHDQHQVLGGPCSRPHYVEKHSEPTPQERGKEAGECRSRKKSLQKGAQQL